MSSTLYLRIDLHEKESQLAVFEQDGSLVEERRIPTGELATFLSSLPGEKRVAMASVGFIYPVYDRLSSLQGCRVTVANVNRLQLISRSSRYGSRTRLSTPGGRCTGVWSDQERRAATGSSRPPWRSASTLNGLWRRQESRWRARTSG